MKLIVLRDENSKFFKSYWKKWYELGRGRQQLRLEERQQALHDLMEGYDWEFDGKNFTEGEKAVELSYKRRMKISKEDVCYKDFEEFENDVLIRVIGEIKDDLIKQFVRASVYKSCLHYLENGTEDDMECMEVYLGEDGSLEELKRELSSMADIADFEERYKQEVG